MASKKHCKLLPVCRLLFSLYVSLFPWFHLAQIFLFEDEGAQVCLSGHIFRLGWICVIGIETKEGRVVKCILPLSNKPPLPFQGL